jgi:hypothetical protein
MGSPDEAHPMYDQVIGIFTKVYGIDHSNAVYLNQ